LLTSILRLLRFHFLAFQGVIRQHSLRQSIDSRITVSEAGSVTQVEVLKAKSIDIFGSILIASSKNQLASPLVLVLVPVTHAIDRTNKHTCIY